MTPPSQRFADALANLAPIDLVGLGLVAALVLLGLWRGLWWQVIRLLGVVFAVAMARVFSPSAGTWIQDTWPDLPARLANGASWVSVFLVALAAASLIGLLGQRLLEVMQLGIVNRLGGGFFGALTGLLVHLALLVVLCQLAPEGFLAKHVSGTYSERLVQQAGQNWRVVLGAEAADELERALERIGAGEGEPAAPSGRPAVH